QRPQSPVETSHPGMRLRNCPCMQTRIATREMNFCWSSWTHFGWDWFSKDYGKTISYSMSPPPDPSHNEGPNGVFRSVRVIRYSVVLRNSARNRFPLTVTLDR